MTSPEAAQVVKLVRKAEPVGVHQRKIGDVKCPNWLFMTSRPTSPGEPEAPR